MAAPPELNHDATAEILLRLPPDDPACLLRSALVCKPWLRILTDPAFLRRYRAFHGSPPLLGLIHRLHLCEKDPAPLHRLQPFQRDPAPRFFPTAAVPAFLHPASSRLPPRHLDCRHGRVFIDMLDGEVERFLVWDPVTGDHHRLPDPDMRLSTYYSPYSAAVICAAAGCDHLDCHGGPFRVALVATDHSEHLIWASVYSSETRSWSKVTSLDNGKRGRISYVNAKRGALIGDEVYFTLNHGKGFVRYDWRKNCLSAVNPPPPEHYNGDVALMVMDDSSLGYAGIKGSSLYLWSRKLNSDGAAEWVQCRVIELGTMIPMSRPSLAPFESAERRGAARPAAAARTRVTCRAAPDLRNRTARSLRLSPNALLRMNQNAVGFAESLGVVFVYFCAGLFMIELKSGRVRKVDGPGVYYSILPYMSFYTPDRCGLSSLLRTKTDSSGEDANASVRPRNSKEPITPRETGRSRVKPDTKRCCCCYPWCPWRQSN